MSTEGLIVQILTMLGYQLPMLLACVAGLAMLWLWVPAVPGRALAIGGMATLLGTAVLQLALSLGQTWMIHSAIGGYDRVSAMSPVFAGVGFLLSLTGAAGVVLLAWGASRAMRAVPRGHASMPAGSVQPGHE